MRFLTNAQSSKTFTRRGGVDSFALLHPYAFLSAQALGIATVLIILARLWFFQRWARLLSVLLLIIAVVYSAIRLHNVMSAPPWPVLAMSFFVLMLNHVIVAMSFLPPVRDMFAIQT